MYTKLYQTASWYLFMWWVWVLFPIITTMNRNTITKERLFLYVWLCYPSTCSSDLLKGHAGVNVHQCSTIAAIWIGQCAHARCCAHCRPFSDNILLPSAKAFSVLSMFVDRPFYFCWGKYWDLPKSTHHLPPVNTETTHFPFTFLAVLWTAPCQLAASFLTLTD